MDEMDVETKGLDHQIQAQKLPDVMHRDWLDPFVTGRYDQHLNHQDDQHWLEIEQHQPLQPFVEFHVHLVRIT